MLLLFHPEVWAQGGQRQLFFRNQTENPLDSSSTLWLPFANLALGPQIGPYCDLEQKNFSQYVLPPDSL